MSLVESTDFWITVENARRECATWPTWKQAPLLSFQHTKDSRIMDKHKPEESPERRVEDLLRDAKQRRSCSVCANEPLARAIAHFLALKNTNDRRTLGVTLNWFYRTKLRETFAGPSPRTVNDHVRFCLKVNPDGTPKSSVADCDSGIASCDGW